MLSNKRSSYKKHPYNNLKSNYYKFSLLISHLKRVHCLVYMNIESEIWTPGPRHVMVATVVVVPEAPPNNGLPRPSAPISYLLRLYSTTSNQLYKITNKKQLLSAV